MKFFKLAVAIPLLVLSLSSNAEFITTDWKVNGDNQAVLHEETGIEWLNLAQTNGMSINEVNGLLDTEFSGFRLPTVSELNQLYSDYFGISGLSDDEASYTVLPEAKVKQFIDLFGNTHEKTGQLYWLGIHTQEGSEAVYETILKYSPSYSDYLSFNNQMASEHTYDTSINNRGIVLVSDGGGTYSSLENPSQNSNNPNAPINNVGVTSVPEPASLAILGAGLMGLAFSRRKKQK